MKKTSKKKSGRVADGMRAEYDLRGGVRGKYAARFAEGTNVVLLDPDVAEAFPDSESVNEILRALLRILDRRKKASRRSRKKA
jgi:hypothetical protein